MKNTITEYTMKITTEYDDKITFKSCNYNSLIQFYHLLENDIKTFNITMKEKERK